MRVLITGAAGNLGSLLTRYLMDKKHNLKLMIHKKNISEDIIHHENTEIFRADLNDAETLNEPCKNADVIVHFAGVLFKPGPEKFLPVTNIQYFKNLVDVARQNNVKKIILISFPHVEGETFPEKPAAGVLTGSPESVHARTRLEEEKYLFSEAENHGFTAVSLRVGMVYGRGILMIDGARWLAKHWLLGVWKKPTSIHLVSTDDYHRCVESAIVNDVKGIYHIGDDGVQTLQEFLDLASVQWGYKKPWRMPEFMIFTAAWLTEVFARIFNTRSPLTRDFIKIGMCSYYGDTGRMKKDLLKELKYPTIQDGIETL